MMHITSVIPNLGACELIHQPYLRSRIDDLCGGFAVQ